jgi:hypothetical protein
MWKRRGAYRDLVENLKKGNNLGDPDVGGRIILEWIFEKWDEGMDWSDLALDRDRWQAFVNTVMNFRVA